MSVEPTVWKFDLVPTLALGGLLLLSGYRLRRAIPWIGRANVPAPVVGGLCCALAVLLAAQAGWPPPRFDMTLKEPLMIAFFTSIGFGVSGALLRRGGTQVAVFLTLSTVFAALQNLLGGSLAAALGEHPLLGVLCGSVTLTGGPATGLAFAPQFAAAGVEGAAVVALAAAMLGIVAAGLLGAPLATLLILRHCPERRRASFPANEPLRAATLVEAEIDQQPVAAPPDSDRETYGLMRALAWILVAMWGGAWLGGWISARGVTLPGYIGAMIVAAGLRNLDDATHWLRLSQRALDELGSMALSFFLVLALMTLDLGQLRGLAVPLCVILSAQIVLIAASLWAVFYTMGKDYDAAVMASGFCGFMLGTTANAMANMNALVEEYGPAPRAYLVVPMVGAFFLDFTNAALITAALTMWR